MTDKQLLEHLVSIHTTNQMQVENNLKQMKFVYQRIELLEQTLQSVVRIIAMEPSEEVRSLAKDMSEMLKDPSLTIETKKMIARTESHHEKIGVVLKRIQDSFDSLD